MKERRKENIEYLGILGNSMCRDYIAGIMTEGASQVALTVKNSPANTQGVRDVSLIPGSGRSLREGHSNSLQYSCLENPMDRGAWWTTVRGVAKSWT